MTIDELLTEPKCRQLLSKLETYGMRGLTPEEGCTVRRIVDLVPSLAAQLKIARAALVQLARFSVDAQETLREMDECQKK